METGRDYFRNKIQDVQRKFAELPRCSNIRSALSGGVMDKLSSDVESQDLAHLRVRSYHPLFLFVSELDLSHIRDLETDIALVVSQTSCNKRRDMASFLREAEEKEQRELNRQFRAGLFEIFVKSRLLRAEDGRVVLDAPLPGCGKRNADAKLTIGGRDLYLEATILSESEGDQGRLRSLCEAMKADPFACQAWWTSPSREADRLRRTVYEKLARKLSLEKSQLTDAHPNVLLISFFGRYTSASPDSPETTSALAELLSDELGNLEQEPAPQPEDTSLGAWLHRYATCQDGRVRLAEAEYRRRRIPLLNLRKRISAILLFKDCELTRSMVNNSANHRVTDSEMARLEDMFSTAPSWSASL